MPTKAEFIEIMAKHLPPSASELHLLDIGGVVGEALLERRPNLHIDIASVSIQHWDYTPNSRDAVLAYDLLLKEDLLAHVLSVMRAGGRFIVVNPLGTVEEECVQLLEKVGFVRILVEPAVIGAGVLIRGEKAHSTDNTLKRIEMIAKQDADLLDLDYYKGRYVHLLIIQTPNKPVWKMTRTDIIEWQAVAIEKEGTIHALAFSSLPKAVHFMQEAVLNNSIHGVNKVAKFSKATAICWEFVTLLNPTLSSIADYHVRLLYINPNSAEASDE